MEKDDLKKNSENYRKISKICVNFLNENPILSELSITPNLAILILETRFPNMKDFSIPLMSQTNSFYPQEKSYELGMYFSCFGRGVGAEFGINGFVSFLDFNTLTKWGQIRQYLR